MEVQDLINYEYDHSFLRRAIIDEIRDNPVSAKKKIELISNGRCEFTNDNFYKYMHIYTYMHHNHSLLLIFL